MPKARAAEVHVYVIATARKCGAPLHRIANDLGLYEPAFIAGSRSPTATTGVATAPGRW